MTAAETPQRPVHDPAQVEVDPYSLPIDEIDPANPYLFEAGVHDSWFKRLRDEAPVHHCAGSGFGPYWSVTRYDDILTVDTSHQVFSSEPAITILDPLDDFQLPMFIAMDRPKHDVQRNTVSPTVGAEALRQFAPIIRERTCDVLDQLPVGERFNWVDRVSIELTTRMLATLFDFPFEERRKLTYWSDMATTIPGVDGMVDTEEEWQQEMLGCLEYFMGLWNERAKEPPSSDFISRLVHGEATRNMEPMEYLGNLMLLIVGGNDTTRSTMSASVLCLDRNPQQFAELKADHALIPNMVSETIRWQTPLAHMRRTALEDTELGGQQIRKGDKVVMWYVSGNRDERFFDRPDDFDMHRENLRKHLSFGFGIHRCMGNRLAELQLHTLWEELLKRFDRIEVVGEPIKTLSVFVKGYKELPVVLHPRRT
ncbi:MAG: cytochrome P450 [Halieaceae bacterium]|jgi:cytochrome P450|nr:cytochrome P450 [Halieaceae bacterium]